MAELCEGPYNLSAGRCVCVYLPKDLEKLKGVKCPPLVTASSA